MTGRVRFHLFWLCARGVALLRLGAQHLWPMGESMRTHHLRARARLVAAVLAAVLSLSLTGPAAANHETNGEDPVLYTPEVWRGWVADEYVDNLGLSNGTLSYARGWWADGDASSLDGNIARYMDAHYYSRTECTDDGARQRGETAAVDSNTSGNVQIYPSDPSAEFGSGYAADEEGLVFNLYNYDNSPEGGGVWHSCAYPGEEEYLPVDGHSGHTAGGGRTAAVVDLSAIPTKIAFTRSYSEGATAIRTVQVCMSRSTIDSDRDGLPDDVDLDPAAAGSLTDLGVPGGPPYEVIPNTLPGGPTGRSGLPACPSAACTTNSPPSSAISAKPVDWRAGRAASNPGVKMAFTGIGRDPEGGPVTFSWLFHDASGTVAKAGQSVTHRWSTAGATRQRKIALTVTDQCGAKAATGLAVWVSGNPDLDFAPVMRLHPNEKFWPMSAGRFVARSSLFFREDNRAKVSGDPSAGRLGRGGYSRLARTGANYQVKRVKSDDLTRPFDAANATSEPAFGFYLDLADGERAGSAPVSGRIRSPMYLQTAGDKRVYWQFYGYSKPTLRDGSGVPGMAHEGDWERVIVDLNGYKVPSRVGFVAHHEPVDYVAYRGAYAPAPNASATVLTTVGLAPVGYVSRLGHGTWPDPGRDCFYGVVCDYRSNNGPTWTGRNDLRSVMRQGWFGDRRDHRDCRAGSPMPADKLVCGYGGGWGRAGSNKDTTGPLGPSAYKAATKN